MSWGLWGVGGPGITGFGVQDSGFKDSDFRKSLNAKLPPSLNSKP